MGFISDNENVYICSSLILFWSVLAFLYFHVSLYISVSDHTHTDTLQRLEWGYVVRRWTWEQLMSLQYYIY